MDTVSFTRVGLVWTIGVEATVIDVMFKGRAIYAVDSMEAEVGTISRQLNAPLHQIGDTTLNESKQGR